MRNQPTFSSNPISIEIPNVSGEVEIWADLKMVDNGIGSYEFHGQKGRDTQIEAEVQQVFWNRKKYNAEQNEIIDNYLDDNQETIDEQLIENSDPPNEPDYPEEDLDFNIERD